MSGRNSKMITRIATAQLKAKHEAEFREIREAVKAQLVADWAAKGEVDATQ